MLAIITFLGTLALAAADSAEMKTINGVVVTDANQFKVTSMDNVDVLTVDDASTTITSDSIAVTGTENLMMDSTSVTVSTAPGEDVVVINGQAITVDTINFTASSQNNVAFSASSSATFAATGNVDISTDALDVSGETVSLTGANDVELAAGSSIVVKASEDAEATVHMSSTEVTIDTTDFTATGTDSVTLAGKDTSLTTGTGGANLQVSETDVMLDAASIVLTGADGTVDIDALVDDVDSLLTEAASLQVELAEVDGNLRERTQAQADRLSTLTQERTELSTALSTDASNTAYELSDLNSGVEKMEQTLSSAIAQDETSLDARMDVVRPGAEALSGPLSTVASNAVAHESAFESRADSLEIDMSVDLSSASKNQDDLSAQVSTVVAGLTNQLNSVQAAVSTDASNVISAEASLESDWLQAQADITNKIAAADGAKDTFETAVTQIEFRAAKAIRDSDVAASIMEQAASDVSTLSTIVSYNDQNFVNEISSQVSTLNKTVARGKEVMIERVDGAKEINFAPSVISTSDYFADDCDIQGMTIACGAENYLSGAVFVYDVHANNASYTLKQTIRNARSSSSADFGGSVDRDGDWMVIGAPYDYISSTADSGTIGGRAFLYKRNAAGVYQLQRRLGWTVPSGIRSSASCGTSVSIKGTTVVVGCPRYGSTSSSRSNYYQGVLMVYNRDTGARTALVQAPVQAGLTSTSYTRYMYLGGLEPNCIDLLDKDTLLLGIYPWNERINNVIYSDVGGAFVLRQASDGSWTPTQLPQHGSPNTYRYLGRRVAWIDPLTVAISADRHATIGAVQIITRPTSTSNTWTEAQMIVNPESTATYTYFGYSFGASADGKKLAIGRYGFDGPSSLYDVGDVWFYDRAEDGTYKLNEGKSPWTQTGSSSLSYSRLGRQFMGYFDNKHFAVGSQDGPTYQSYMGSLFIRFEQDLFPEVEA